MPKRIAALLLLLSMFFSLLGCSALYKKEYLSVSDYKEDDHKDYTGDYLSIEDYDELKTAIISMVNRHSREERFKFIGYGGSLQSDLAQACWEVKSETALASYAVEYMTYDFSRVVTYYEAVISITYKRTEEDIESIHYLSGMSKLPGSLEEALDDLEPQVCFKLTSSTVTEESVAAAVQSAYFSNPAGCVLMPDVEISIHPLGGVQKIVELNFEYGKSSTKINQLKTQLTDKIKQITSVYPTGRPAEQALQIFNTVSGSCTYDPDGALRSTNQALDKNLGNTAYGALVDGFADSMGMALAYSALCREEGIPCFVVIGKLDSAEHAWNIIKIDDTYYHVDVSMAKSTDVASAFLRNDSQMQGSYWWNIENYPTCEGLLGYYELFNIKQ